MEVVANMMLCWALTIPNPTKSISMPGPFPCARSVGGSDGLRLPLSALTLPKILAYLAEVAVQTACELLSSDETNV